MESPCPDYNEDKDTAEEHRRLRHQRLKHRCVWIFAVVVLVSGVVDGIVPLRGLLGLTVAGLLGLTCLAWCSHDEQLHRRRTTLLVKLLILVAMPLGLGLYLVLRGRWRSLLVAAALGIALAVGAGLLSAISSRICYGQWAVPGDLPA